MARTLVQSPTLQLSGGVVENGEPGARRTRESITSNSNCNCSRLTSSVVGSLSSGSGRGLQQSFSGIRRPNPVDALGARSERNFHSPTSTVIARPPWRRIATAAPPRVTVGVVAEFGDKATELTIDPEQSETAESANGHNNASFPPFPDSETGKSSSSSSSRRVWRRNRGVSVVDEDGNSRSFNGVVDSYRPVGSGRSVDGASSVPQESSSSSGNFGTKGVMVDRWVPPGSKLHQVKQLLERLEGAEPTEEAVEEAMEGWDSSISPRDVSGVLSNLRWKKAHAFFNWVKSHGVEVNVVVCNVLLGTFRAGRVWDVADAFGQQMVEEGLELDNYTYSILISCALQCNRPLDALRWFDKMHDAGCVPDEVTYSNMALVYSRLGRFDEAVALYDRLKGQGWKPDKISFGTMVNVYSRGGNYFKASQVIREMQEAGMQPEAVVYNTLIKYFAREGKTGQAKRVFQDMERAGVKPSEYTLSLMIDVHGRAGESKEAFQLFSRMKEEKLPLDVVVYNSLLKMCAEERLAGEAENLLAGMVGRGLKPDSVTYKSVVNLYAKEGKVNEAEKFADRMVEAGLPLDVVVYSCLMKACGIAKDFKRAETFFDRMLADGCHVDDKCCGVLLSLLNLSETKEDRAIVIGCLQESKPLLSGTINMLLREDIVEVSELREQIQDLLADSDVGSHRPFCNALVDICWSLGKKDRAQDVLFLADSLKVYPGGLRTKSKQFWVLHLRSLSFGAAECGLHTWLAYLREQVHKEEEFPESIVIETGAGRNREDVTRLFNVIQAKLKEMGAPFEPTPDRADWIVSSGPALKSWLAETPVPV